MSSLTSRIPEALLDDLQELEFSDYEARAYVALLRAQPATAYEISKTAGIPKANAYAVLESLNKKGAAQPVSKSPLRHTAVSPDVLFNKIAGDMQRRCGRVQHRLGRLAQVLDDDYVWSVDGMDSVIARIEEMIAATEDHLWVKATDAVLNLFRASLDRASERGVGISIVPFGADAGSFKFNERSKTWLHEGNGISVGMASSLITIARDHEECLIAQVTDTASGSSTRNRSIVNTVETLLRHEIYFAEIFGVYGAAIEKTFGPALIELRRKYLPAGDIRKLSTTLARAGRRPASTDLD